MSVHNTLLAFKDFMSKLESDARAKRTSASAAVDFGINSESDQQKIKNKILKFACLIINRCQSTLFLSLYFVFIYFQINLYFRASNKLFCFRLKMMKENEIFCSRCRMSNCNNEENSQETNLTPNCSKKQSIHTKSSRKKACNVSPFHKLPTFYTTVLLIILGEYY